MRDGHRLDRGDRAPGPHRPPGEQRAAATRQRCRGLGAVDRAARCVRRRGAVGDRLPQPQPPLRGARTDGGARLGRRRARDRCGARPGQLLPAPRDDGPLMGIPGLPQPTGVDSWFVGGAIKAMLSAIGSAVDSAAAEALRLTGSILGSTTSPGLLSTWFSATYWRVAALSALLTVPFLFAAAIHALVRSDLALLGRAAFGYLPLAAIGVTVAAPLTTLLLSATDEMCAIVAAAAGHADGAALARAASGIVALSAMTGNPMLAFFIGLLAVVATIGLWIELLIRAAAVDVIVLMLPLFFAAMVWPARRVWAIRAIETLVALILAKFAIVAVLTLGGAAFGGPGPRLSSSLVGATLIVLAVLSPWALLRLLPLHEVAAAAASGLSQAPRAVMHGAGGTLYDGVRAAAAGPDPDLGPFGPQGGDDAEASLARAAGSGGPPLFDRDSARGRRGATRTVGRPPADQRCVRSRGVGGLRHRRGRGRGHAATTVRVAGTRAPGGGAAGRRPGAPGGGHGSADHRARRPAGRPGAPVRRGRADGAGGVMSAPAQGRLGYLFGPLE